MSKVVFMSEKTVFSPEAGSMGARHTRSCRICGNGFLPMNASARTCEFCKTPFSGIVSGALISALKNATAS